MSTQATLFQILFQNETLFHLPEDKRAIIAANELAIAKNTSITPIVTSSTVNPGQGIATPVVVDTPVVQEFPPLSHQILILTEDEKQPKLNETEALFLDNILKAVKYSINEADIFNFSFLPPTDVRSVFSEKKISYFITFGVPLIKLNVDLLLIPYTPKQIKGIWFLMADPLPLIEADRELKKKLWQALKQMFEQG